MRLKHVFLVGVSTVAACVGVPAAAQVANPVIPAETTQATAAEAPSASAQTVPQPDVVPNVDDPAGDASQDIVVTGLRASQQQAIQIKRDAINVVDSITTQDIGKLPEQNVAESLQRIPGVTISRNGGDGQFVSVRGLGPQFNVVTLNGRTLATDNIGREFSFDILPSELIGGADVYKSPTARLNGASIGATVDVRTIRPLEQKAFVLAASFDMQNDDLPGTWNPRASGVISWHNADGTFGASLVGSYQKRDIRIDEFDIGAGWVQHSSNDSYYAGRVAPSVGTFTNVSMPSNMSPSFITSKRERIGASGTVQYKPTSNLTATLDGFYSKLNQLDHQSSIAYDFGGGTLVDQVVENGAAQTQTFTGGFVDQIVSRNPRIATTFLVGLNLDWKKDDFHLSGDLSKSRAKRTGNEDQYFSTIRRVNSTLTWDRRTGSPIFDVNFSNPNYPNAPTDVNNIGAHYEADGGTNTKDDTLEFHLDGDWNPGGAIKVYGGMAYADRSKRADSIAQPPASQCAFCGGTTYVPLPSSLFTTTPNNWFPGYRGNTIRQWIDYDPRTFTQALAAYQSSDPNFVGYQRPVFSPAQSSVVKEKVWIGYLMFDIKSDLGAMPLSINAGIRFEDTSFTSNGAAQTIVSAASNGQGQNIITLSPVVPIGFNGHYTDLLPSMNARLDLTDKLLLRLAASRVMSRPTLTDLSPAQTILSNPGNEQITRGNPNLLPFRASQIEGGLEWYLNRFSLLSGAVFYKSIDSFVARATTPQLVDQVTFQVTTPTNGKGAIVKGFELSYRQAFAGLPSPFDGLGAQASYTFVDSDANYQNQVTGTSYGLEGLSKNSYSLVGFYEKFGLQARVAYTWRDKYLQVAQGRNGLPTYFDAYGQVDASITYNINEHFSVSANALNVNNAKEFTYQVMPSQTFSYALTGRRYLLGARMKF
jgi:iron complex outermembrane receptor protein